MAIQSDVKRVDNPKSKGREDHEFPCLVEGVTSGHIYLALTSKHGVRLQGDSTTSFSGMCYWCRHTYKDFNGSVTLKNRETS